MNTKELAEKYSVSQMELDAFILGSDFKYKSTMLNGIIVMEDAQTVMGKFREYLRNQRLEEERQEQEEKEQEERRIEEIFFVNEEQSELIESIRSEAQSRAVNDLVYEIKGSLGRSIRIYPYKCVITTTLATKSATDGEKTIYFKDCIGIQYRRPGAAFGYLQFETAVSAVNNEKNSLFNENTFTFDEKADFMDDVYEFVIGAVDRAKIDL